MQSPLETEKLLILGSMQNLSADEQAIIKTLADLRQVAIKVSDIRYDMLKRGVEREHVPALIARENPSNTEMPWADLIEWHDTQFAYGVPSFKRLLDRLNITDEMKNHVLTQGKIADAEWAKMQASTKH